MDSVADIQRDLGKLILSKNFPCVAAAKSYSTGEFIIRTYEQLGSGLSTKNLSEDLAQFLAAIENKKSPYLSFFAVFKEMDEPDSEKDFENKLWHELSLLAANPSYAKPWDPRFSADPSSESFCFSFAGKAFFVVGLHPKASRPARRFKQPVLVFNSFDQFEMLKARGEYFPMVDLNRKRDVKFSGEANPMAVQFGEKWESIQFSGRQNSKDWKCPFQHLRPEGVGHALNTLAPQTGTAFRLQAGERLEVIDPQGQQVCDLFCFDWNDRNEYLSASHSVDYNDTIFLTRGHSLYSNASGILLKILEDECGRHDFLMPPCSLKMFQLVGQNNEDHPSCHGNLSRAFKPFGIEPHQITTTFNIFMNVAVRENGALEILPPLSRPGARIVMQAERDLLVGLTACSHPQSNAGRCKPIQYQIHKA